MLELLVSPPGTGKTEYCINLFREQLLKSKSGIDNRSFFVLPNREHAERIQHLVLRHDLKGVFNAHIVTINDLAGRVLGPGAHPAPSQNVRRRVLSGILADPAVVKGLPYFERVRELEGFRELLADTIREFKGARLGTAEFERRAQALLKDPAFRAKYRDFSVVLKNYDARLEAMGLCEPEDGWPDLVKPAPAGNGAPELLIFDGFYHFTRAQGGLLLALARWARRTVVTLTLSPGERLAELFAYPERTRQFLTAGGFKQLKPLPENHRTRSDALRHLESNLFSADPKRFERAQDAVSLIRAATPRAEIERVARRILKIHRETPVHFSDICLIFRHIGDYEQTVRSVFAEFGIPVHVHERRLMIANGLLAVFYRFLNFIAEWRREDLAFVMKSSHAGGALAPGEAALWEQSAASAGVAESREGWAGQPDRFVKSVLETEQSLVRCSSAAAIKAGILGLLRGWARQDAEDRAALDAFESLLETVRAERRLEGLTVFDPAAFLAELKALLKDGLFTVKPEGKNRVQVYDAIMALPKEYKVVFVCGLTDRQFPPPLPEHALFDDSERRALNAKDPVLEERRLRAAGERYFFYMALTRARERLVLTHPLEDADGRAVSPSLYIEEAARCFKHGLPVEERKAADFLPAPSEWASAREAVRGAAETVFQSGDRSRGALPLVLEWAGHPRLKRIALAALTPRPGRLADPRTLKEFVTDPLSSTRIKTFATCAFKYFANYVLRLEETAEGYEERVMGDLMHEALERFYLSLSVRERETGDYLTDIEAMRGRLRRAFDTVMAERRAFAREPLYRQNLFRRQMEAALDAFPAYEASVAGKRGLVPTHFEWKFDNLVVPAPGGADIRLEGKIDRIDVEKGGRRAVVIDYKRSARDLTKDIERGLEFQLPVYVLAARRLLGLDVVAAEHRILRSAGTRRMGAARAREFLGLDKRHALYPDEVYERILSSTEESIRRQVENIRRGEISVKPKSCRFCGFAAVCRFEEWRIVYLEETK